MTTIPAVDHTTQQYRDARSLYWCFPTTALEDTIGSLVRQWSPAATLDCRDVALLRARMASDYHAAVDDLFARDADDLGSVLDLAAGVDDEDVGRVEVWWR